MGKSLHYEDDFMFPAYNLFDVYLLERLLCRECQGLNPLSIRRNVESLNKGIMFITSFRTQVNLKDAKCWPCLNMKTKDCNLFLDIAH